MKQKIICFALITIAALISVKASNNARRRSANRLFREKAILMQFLNSTGQILKKRNATDPTVDNWLHYFQKDLRSAFAVGTVYLRLIEQYELKDTTKLTPEENVAVQDAFKILVNDYRNHDSYALWMGDNQGGTATAAIFKYVGGDPVALLGPRNNPNDVMSEIIYPTEKPHSPGDALIRGSFKCSGTPTVDKVEKTTAAVPVQVTISPEDLEIEVKKEMKLRSIIINGTNERTQLAIELLVKDLLNTRLQLSKTYEIISSERSEFQSELHRKTMEFQSELHNKTMEFKSELHNKTMEFKSVLDNKTMDLESAMKDAAFIEFIALYRNALVHLENHYCTGAPSEQKAFVSELKTIKEYKELEDTKIFGKKHFRKWLWMLNFGDEKIFHQLSKLRNLLEKDRNLYMWFADKAQEMFDFLSDEVHNEFQAMNMKFVQKHKIRDYLKGLTSDLRRAAEIYFISEGWIEKEENPNQ